MKPAFDLKNDLLILFAVAVLFLLAVPLVGVAVSAWGESRGDTLVFQAIEANIDQSDEISAEDKLAMKQFFREHPASVACTTTDPELREYQQNVCGPGSDAWQFMWGRRASWAGVILAVVALLGAVGLGLLAFVNRRAQYLAFVLGWAGLTAISVIEVLLQGALSVWLSYWVTALALGVYVPKLILLVAAIALMGMFSAIRAILQKVPQAPPLEAELVSDGEAPALWTRLRQLAASLQTQPPRHLVAGIDDNFFVTEAPVRLGERTLEGRTLFVSVPLLRVLESSEADAVLAHELAHFQGGDAASSAKLGPKLVRFDQYASMLAGNVLTLPAHFLLGMFRTIFELAKAREQRQRELRADAQAAKVTSGDALGRSLIKIVGYSCFRNQVERELFSTQEQYSGAPGIGARVHAGFSSFTGSSNFAEQLAEVAIPHPFDSHPPLPERLANVNCAVELADSARLFERVPAHTWVDEMGTASDIEHRLWSAYENRFSQAHELSLAHRCLPATDEERALVEKHFPPVVFPLKDGGVIRMTWQGIQVPTAAQPLAFTDVFDVRLREENFLSELMLSHVHGSTSGVGPTCINLRHLGNEAEDFQGTFARYWRRAHAANEYVAETSRTLETG